MLILPLIGSHIGLEWFHAKTATFSREMTADIQTHYG